MVIGMSLSEPHNDGKIVCLHQFMAIYDQMQNIFCHCPFHGNFTIKYENKTYKYFSVTQGQRNLYASNGFVL